MPPKTRVRNRFVTWEFYGSLGDYFMSPVVLFVTFSALFCKGFTNRAPRDAGTESLPALGADRIVDSRVEARITRFIRCRAERRETARLDVELSTRLFGHSITRVIEGHITEVRSQHVGGRTRHR